jgi:predicted nucleic acid-binding protein
LACALDAGADLIVSGDHHLLDLGEYQGIPNVTVRAFLARLEIGSTGG